MKPVLAYLDPGSGSMLLQALLGGIASLAVGMKLFGARILMFMRLRRPESEEGADRSETDPG